MISVTHLQSPLIAAAVATWPGDDWPHWHLYNSEEQSKRSSKDHAHLPPAAQLLIAEMARHAPLVPPQLGAFPDLYLHGSGLSMMTSEGFIAKHVDAARHPLRPWKRVASSVLFLTACRGGQLLIDNHDPITPIPGRMVRFPAEYPHEVLPVIAGLRLSVNLFWWQESTSATGATRAMFG